MEAITSAGLKIKYGQFAANFTAAQWKDQSSVGANGGLVTTEWLGQNANTSAMKLLNADFKASHVPFEEVTVGAWTDSELFAVVAKSIKGSLTSATFWAAMKKVKGLNLGTLPAHYQTQHAVSAHGYNRVFTALVYVDTLQNGKLIHPKNQKPIDASATFH